MLIIGWSWWAFAQEAEPPRKGWRDHVRVRGYVDAYAAFDAARTADHRRPGFLYSKARTEGVSVDLALLGAELDTRNVRAAATLMAGTFTEDNQGFEEPGLRNVYEARVGVRLGGRTWIDAGVFPSHLGAESAIGIDNPTLTRSLTAENSPYYLAGVKLGTAVGDQLELGVIGANGWQTIRQTSPPSIGGGSWVTWRPAQALTLNWSTWIGVEQPSGASRLFSDLYGVASFDRVDLIGWLDVGTQAGSSWGGGNLQVRTWLTSAIGVSGRLEHFRDPEGVVVQVDERGAVLSGGSVGLDLVPTGLLDLPEVEAMWRLEYRALHADRAMFEGSPWNHLLTTSLAAGF